MVEYYEVVVVIYVELWGKLTYVVVSNSVALKVTLLMKQSPNPSSNYEYFYLSPLFYYLWFINLQCPPVLMCHCILINYTFKHDVIV